MTNPDKTTGKDDKFDLGRFISAQEDDHAQALSELRNGRKRSHWMWYIFPQIDGLGSSATSRHFAIKSKEEAKAYLEHPLLGARLVECTETVFLIRERSAHDIFGYPDDLKFKSCMTLFEALPGADSIFARSLEKYFNGERDSRTLQLLERLSK